VETVQGQDRLFVRSSWKEKDPQGVLPADKEATMRRRRRRRRRRRTDSSSTASGENGGGSGARAVEVVREAGPGAATEQQNSLGKRGGSGGKETRKREVGELAGTHRG
jgi:hypothetical protein